MKQKKSSILSDILGALAGTAVVLPQSMGLGVVLFSVMGFDASSGAFAGIIGAAILSIISGLFGATLGMFSAPNGPVTMLLIGIFTIMSANAASSELMLLTLSVILMLTGAFQILFSLVGGAKLVKFMPYPVIVGLVTGIGILMIKSQMQLFISAYDTVADLFIASIPLFVGLMTVAAIVLTPKFTSRVPATLVGLLFGIFTYQVLNYFYLHDAYGAWVVGAIPSMDSLHFGISIESLNSLDFMVIVPAALALTVLATTDCLVTAIVADSQTNTRHNGKVEIIAQGLGQIVTGFVGGLGGGGTKGATLVNLQSGGGRFSAVFSGLSFLALIVFFGTIGNYLPLSVLAGVIVFVGYGMINFNIIDWMKYKKSRVDAFIALIVIAVVILVDLVSAVGIGIVISMIMYIRMQIKAPIVHRITNAINRKSLTKRTDEELEVLKTEGEKIVMLELTGTLFFATADKLLEEIEVYKKEDYCVILHFQRVKFIDLTGVIILLQIASSLKNVNAELVLCHMHKELGIGKKINRALKSVDKKNSIKIRTFINIDTAFEYAENRLLKLSGIKLRTIDDYLDVEENQFCKNVPTHIISLIKELSVQRTLENRAILFNQDELGSSLFMVLKGEIDIKLYFDKKSYKLLGRYGAGTYFGEIAFLNPGKRTACAQSKGETVVLELSKDALLSLDSKDKEELAMVLLFELGTTLGEELRSSANEIRRLEAI
ncbi:MAG: SulP family inorganic anion transporter [Campylobacterota bacterium]|nr:SulP family inorganic anion transporter [Campylobacterota bacterium]